MRELLPLLLSVDFLFLLLRLFKKKSNTHIFELTFLCNTVCAVISILIQLITTKLYYYLSMCVLHAYRSFVLLSHLALASFDAFVLGSKISYKCYCQNVFYKFLFPQRCCRFDVDTFATKLNRVRKISMCMQERACYNVQYVLLTGTN